LNAAALRTILPSHSMTAISPIFSIYTLSIILSESRSIALKHELRRTRRGRQPAKRRVLRFAKIAPRELCPCCFKG
jgi:hypothetical protein